MAVGVGAAPAAASTVGSAAPTEEKKGWYLLSNPMSNFLELNFMKFEDVVIFKKNLVFVFYLNCFKLLKNECFSSLVVELILRVLQL